ncbi:sensor histidine kinase [Pseudonocardia sp.]|uniref:sensor histidine kinase n=1 Tax=Pseudonocardia sp. TaxID=60912 RepID=UPI002620195B|nr:sensor histidine kinase [Pseudonocardia sp.]
MTNTPRPAGLEHDALFYETPEQYDAAVLAFVHAGRSAEEPVLVAVPDPNLTRIRDALDGVAGVRTADMAVAGRNPGRIIGNVLTAFAHEHRGRRVRIVGEPIWAGRSVEEYPACAEHEALINVALAELPAYVLCPYDVSRLTPDVLTDATRTHPVLAHGTARWPSAGYTDPRAVAASFDRDLPPAPRDADVLIVDRATGPRAARRFVHSHAARAGLAPDRIADLRHVVQELAVNTIVHSGGAGLLTVWHDAEHVVVQLQDGGRFTDQLAGRRPPAPPEVGHGLFLVHALADLVRIHHGAHGTVVRVHIAL